MGDRELSFGLAINEALTQAMEEDPGLIVIGQGVKSPWYVGNTCRGLVERFGETRVIDSPVSENAVTGAAVGAALAGSRAVVVHPRMDFMLFAFDPIVNQAANWHAMSGGRANVPVVFWGIVNRGGEQAAQHSQAFHSMLAHVPGLKVVAPSTPRDAKGLMLAAIHDEGPVVFIDDRWLYEATGPVPEDPIPEPIGVSVVRRQGSDVTIVGFSSMMPPALEAAADLASKGVSAEVIDLRTLKPLDLAPVCASLRKTGRGVVCDTGWKTGGIGAEICAQATEGAWGALRAPLSRVALPDWPAPAARTLEAVYYPGPGDVVGAAESLIQGTRR